MLKYCIQEHKAKKLHYDLRLEYKEKAKSWALPKKPEFTDGQKRLAIQVEDHDIDYMGFEGTISSGYGAGTVKIWDKGSYKPKKIETDKCEIIISGKKLKGEYLLIHYKDEKWLMFSK